MSKKKTIILIAALAAAYFFFTKARKKGGKQNTSPLTPQPNPQNNTIGSVKPGASTAGSQKKSFADYLNSVLGLFNKGSKGGSGIKVGGGGSSGGSSTAPSIETQNNTIGSVKPGASTAGSQKKSFADYLNSV